MDQLPDSLLRTCHAVRSHITCTGVQFTCTVCTVDPGWMLSAALDLMVCIVLGSWITTVAWPREEQETTYLLLLGKFVMG